MSDWKKAGYIAAQVPATFTGGPYDDMGTPMNDDGSYTFPPTTTTSSATSTAGALVVGS